MPAAAGESADHKSDHHSLTRAQPRMKGTRATYDERLLTICYDVRMCVDDTDLVIFHAGASRSKQQSSRPSTIASGINSFFGKRGFLNTNINFRIRFGQSVDFLITQKG